MKKLIYILIFIILCTGCSDFLEIKPDKKMSVPKTLEDCELLLNDYGTLNSAYTALGIIAGEPYYLNSPNWNSIADLDDRNAYIWSEEPNFKTQAWQGPYRVVYICNQIMQILDKLTVAEKESARFKAACGHARFLRAFAYQELISVYTLPYNVKTADIELGVPIRLMPDIDVVSKRASLQDSYKQVISDYQAALGFLDVKTTIQTGTSKSAAYAGLARLFLDMKDYDKAYRYADSAWSLKPYLLDYNTLNSGANFPITKYNQEVLFSALTVSSNAFGRNYIRMNPDLIASYQVGDLRKENYFQPNLVDLGTFGFKGSYDGGPGGAFIGLTSSEVLLIRAESAARLQKIDEALKDVNFLRKYRWTDHIYPIVTEQEPNRLLDIILQERGKELVFRGRRWSDIKRLSDDPHRAIYLERIIDNKTYSLPIGSLKYAIQIPAIVMEQNPNIKPNKR
ncbi:RagB/SusD family nutrient uptake outer membrane protein [Sphingobacterium sp. UDSM-2020]|uniref:RagB/SusD family nutrient uptake outer membrane protein n=1 Tax=Sphingobacterium sp. UDSM-2020 TaxID=2795738 RepID=UPI001937DD38|nr:RagB/SusD family nutrient uptake outer membrane protein [Sphingobacterium sp. UDSM-2020]QQD14262.1 RagB/SusD family nutrient uptake outer membrane protein [Sphingobacterium sp. UDSM-2020]